MNVILLSGGSGKRLWPLSNDVRSKQFLKIFRKVDEFSTREYIPRETLRKVATPQAYRYGLLLRAYRRAFEEQIGIFGSAYTNTMMVDLGETLWFAAGSDKNIKLTSKDDLELFKAYLRMEMEQ